MLTNTIAEVISDKEGLQGLLCQGPFLMIGTKQYNTKSPAQE